MKKNRRSQRNKAEKYKDKAEYLLANFSWEKEERILLEVMLQGTLDISDAREVNWTEVSEGLNSIVIRGVELNLSEESIADFRTAMKELKDFAGNEIDPRDTLHKVFTHQTGKEINKTLQHSD
ncbi:MAG: hypothetical protein JEY91_13885 [Spirochaetaceae bacterium]|nr:hypothetical protein [Spirochaetaceae bacterium]